MGYDILEFIDLHEIPETNEFDTNDDHYTTVIFDDLMNSDRDTLRKIASYFTESRHGNLTSIMIAQVYHKIPQDIRLNSLHCIVFPQPMNTHNGIIERDNGLSRGALRGLAPHESILINKLDGRVFKNLDEEITNP